MFKTVKKDADKLVALEQAVADRTTDLTTARGEFREKREKLDDIRAVLAEREDSPELGRQLATAMTAMSSASETLGLAQAALADAERSLAVFREAPERAQTGAMLRTRKARISALRNELLPGLRDLQAEVVETYHNGLLFSLSGGSKQIHESLPDHLDFLIGYLEAPGGLTLFLDHVASYAAGVVDGSRPLDLGANFLKDKRQLAKAS
jgi:hypothetical protein